MSIELKQAAQQALKELGEARKIIRASSSRQLAKDWDRRATDALANLRTAIQQAESEPVYWEWRHQGSHSDSVDFGQWSEWKRVEARSAIHTIDDALAGFRAYIAQGYKYELRPLYTHPAPSGLGDVVRDAQRYRWLRSLEHCNEAWCFIGSGNANSNLDAAIDAAMLTAAQAQHGSTKD